MSERDLANCIARELAESIADRLCRLEPESTLLGDALRLAALLADLAELERTGEINERST